MPDYLKDQKKNEFYKRYGAKLKKIRIKKSLTQDNIVDKSDKSEFKLMKNKTDVSRLENNRDNIWNHLSLPDIEEICGYYEITLKDLVDTTNDDIDVVENQLNVENSLNFLVGNSNVFDGYYGDFFCYFKSTKKDENLIIEANLKIVKNEEGLAEALFVINLPIINPEHKKNSKKEYYGNMVYLKKAQFSYIFLKNDDMLGEFVTICCMHPLINDDRIKNKCRLSYVLSTSSGITKEPIISKMLITDKKIKKEKYEELLPILSFQSNMYVVDKNGLDEKLVSIGRVSNENYIIFDQDKLVNSRFLEVGYEENEIQDIEKLKLETIKHSKSSFYHARLSNQGDETIFNVLNNKDVFED